jgi:hypothetical protein
MMTTATDTVAEKKPSWGRNYLWAGVALCVLAVGLVIVQYGVGLLIVPWYAPVLTTLAVILVVCSLAKRRTVVRFVAAGLIGLLAGLEWHFLTSLSKLPEYQGPAQVGQQIPAFETKLADGQPFADQDLRDSRTSVLVFFRGRW